MHSGVMSSFSPSPLPRRARCTFVPPYLLRHLATEDHPSVAAAEHPSGHTLRIDAGFRERREQAARRAVDNTERRPPPRTPIAG